MDEQNSSHTLVSWPSADGGKLPTSTRRQVNTCFSLWKNAAVQWWLRLLLVTLSSQAEPALPIDNSDDGLFANDDIDHANPNRLF